MEGRTFGGRRLFERELAQSLAANAFFALKHACETPDLSGRKRYVCTVAVIN
jgi:hypothetical protein